MSDAECIAFLQWALPRLDLYWPGFRKVHAQVCKRIKGRMDELELPPSFAAYRARLEADPQEWCVLDACCHISISRFFRDRGVFETLSERLLPELARDAEREGRDILCWSAGCASGEEPYTLKLVWDLSVAHAFPGVALSIVATDVDADLIERARAGLFPAGSLKELPPHLMEQGFARHEQQFSVRERHREGVSFVLQDLRVEAPTERFDLILCRNTAFTYFAPPLQRIVLVQLLERLRSGGYLVLGKHERLPEDVDELAARRGEPIYKRVGIARQNEGLKTKPRL